MARYIPTQQFAVFVGGVPFVFSPDHIEDGELGYKELPKGLSKAQRALFRVVGGKSDEVVETATAAPGEKRVTK